MTVINFTDVSITVHSLDTQEFTLPMSLASMARLIHIDDARLILFARHYPNIPSNIKGIFK